MLAFPDRPVISRYRISVPPAVVPPGYTLEEILRLLKPTGFMVDLVIRDVDVTRIVEAKTDNESQAIGQLLFYRYLLEKYAALQEFPALPVVPVLLFARHNQDLEEFARSLGVQVAFFSPPWIQEFLRMGYSGGG